MNKKFSYDINPNKNIMRKNTYTDKELDFIISIRTKITINNASSLKFFNNYYLPVDEESGEVISSKNSYKYKYNHPWKKYKSCY